MELTNLLQLFQDVRAWFNEAGWLANAIALGGPIAAVVILLWKYVRPYVEANSFRQVIGKLVVPIWSTDSAREIAEIAIVDDNLSDFPVAELKKAGYHVKTFRHVSLGDVPALEKYDVVFLDMHGIVKDDMQEGGLKLIAKLRSGNPRQKICAVSSKTFDPTATAFFKQADDYQKKPLSAHKCQEVLEALMLEKLDPARLAQLLDEKMHRLSPRKRYIVVKKLIEASKSRAAKDTDVFSQTCRDLGQDFLLMADDLIRIMRHVSR